jgi:hypothetical protein
VFEYRARANGPITRLGGWVVIEPPRPPVGQCGPHELSHHAAINDTLMRNGGSMTFAR